MVHDAGRRGLTDYDLKGAALYPVPDGGTEVIGVGVSGPTSNWLDWDGVTGTGGFSMMSCPIEPFAPINTPDGGTLVPVHAPGCSQTVSIELLGPMTSTQPYVRGPQLATANNGRVSLAANARSLWFAHQANGDLIELLRFPIEGGEWTDEFKATTLTLNTFAGIVTPDDAHVYVVTSTSTASEVTTFAADGGLYKFPFANRVDIVSVAFVPPATLAFGGVCTQPGGICSAAGDGFIGLLPAP
jgi:hypothetical protein